MGNDAVSSRTIDSRDFEPPVFVLPSPNEMSTLPIPLSLSPTESQDEHLQPTTEMVFDIATHEWFGSVSATVTVAF